MPSRSGATQVAALAFLVLMIATPEARAQDLVPVEDREARLDGWLTTWGESAESSRLWSGGLGIGGSAVLTGIGIWQAVDDASVTDAYAIAFVAAALDLAIGITQLLVPTVPELRLRRWRAARSEGPLDEAELTAFEGELNAEAESARYVRSLSIGIGLGLVAAGGVGLGLTAGLGQDELAWALGYAASGLGILIGGVLAVVALFDTPFEQEWDAYRRGFAPPSVRVTPIVSPTVLGLGASGSF